GGYTDARWWLPEDWQWIQSQSIDHPLFWERGNGRWYWRGMFDLIPLPLAWPVYVSHAEAAAFARWRDARLPTAADFHRAALGTWWGGKTPHMWGDEDPARSSGVFVF